MNRRDFIRVAVLSAGAVAASRILPSLAKRGPIPIGCDVCGAHVFTLDRYISYRRGETLCEKHYGGGVLITRWYILGEEDFGEAFIMVDNKESGGVVNVPHALPLTVTYCHLDLDTDTRWVPLAVV